MSKELISVIVPCYNEAEGLGLFYEKTSQVLREMVSESLSQRGVKQAVGQVVNLADGPSGRQNSRQGVDYEILFVDDGSTDGTGELIKGLAAKDRHCRYVMFSRNFGKEAAMYAGLRESKGDYCVMMDADLQHPPTLLPQMYQTVSQEGWDCCGGKRVGREGDGAVRSFLSRGFYKICKALTHLDMGDGYGDFRMMKRTMVDAILEMKEYNRYMKGIFSFVGFQTKWIPYENVERAAGTTKWNLKSLFGYAMEGILSFSTAPLKAAGIFGVLLLMAGSLYLFANLIQGFWMPLSAAITELDVVLSLVLLLAGIQMIFLYILGAYLSKDYMENKKRPVYIVRERG
ncbi:MAG: glycosyltransferase family 2 protein [Firmicutes bacterium]|nr:glycosyltransferase family 2 protein [Bacillota bacterium]